MDTGKIDKLIINSPYEEPKEYWSYNKQTGTFNRKKGRRPAGYVIASEKSKSYDDPGTFVEIPLVNNIRIRVKDWRNNGYPGLTGITKKLLEHWYDLKERHYRRFFFCQLEAIETLIWLSEAPDSDMVGIDIPPDGGEFRRICSKMATGSGKTIVMAMAIAWHVLNKVSYPQDKRFSKNVFIVAPGLTVKSRLEVLKPSSINNYYDEFNIIPISLRDMLYQGKVIVKNWHALNWETYEQLKKKRSVDKRGIKSDEAYVREVLEDMSNAGNILLINDEAHHAWRVPAESKIKGVKKEEIEEATKWIGGLDRIHKARIILSCYDFSATPFAPTGKKTTEEALFPWIVSDFGLNDAIESGLVKTPRVVIRDDALPDTKSYRSKLYHIYPHVKDDITRKAEPQEPLPDLIINGYYLLGKDWLETLNTWKESGEKTPPVMISVANITNTAARIKYSFDHKAVKIDELCDPENTLHIDSKVLEEAESQIEEVDIIFDKDEDEPRKYSKKDSAYLLRHKVNTVGKDSMPGEQIKNVISVGMLSEGWDTKTVTHIMGLRAFSSQLLCEQVVGRGLRRTSYEIDEETGFFDAEYVNIFGVPFTFLPHEGGGGEPPKPPKPKTEIKPVSEKQQYEISWPNIIRIDHTYKPLLSLDIDRVNILELDATDTPTIAEMAPVIDGKPDVTKTSEIDIESLGKKFRTQRIIFETAGDVFEQMKPNWKGSKEFLLGQLIKLIEKFIKSDKIDVVPSLFNQDELRRRIIITLNMKKVVQHIFDAIRFENTESLEPVFDPFHPIRSTGDMVSWYTGKPHEYAKKSHINFCVFDSTWEASEAFELDRNKNVKSWVKNDHIGFNIHYIYQGIVRKYWPDFIIRFTNGNFLVLEVKGRDTHQDKTKRDFLDEWCKAVNEYGKFGHWKWTVSFNPKDIKGLIDKAISSN